MSDRDRPGTHPTALDGGRSHDDAGDVGADSTGDTGSSAVSAMPANAAPADTGQDDDTEAPADTGQDDDAGPRASAPVTGPADDRTDRGAAPHRRVPRFLTVVLGLAGLIVVLLFVQAAKDVVAPVFLGLNLLIVVYPLQQWLERFVHRLIAATVSLVIVVGIILGFFLLAGWAVSQLVIELPDHNDAFVSLWRQALTWLDGLGLSASMIQQGLSGVNAGSVMSLLTPVLSNVTAVSGAVATLILAVFFLTLDSVSLPHRLGLIARSRPHITTALRSFAQGVRRYWLVTTVFGLIVAVLDVIALSLIGVPLIWAWGVLAFLTNYIPNIGFVIGLVPPALLALLDGGWVSALAVVIAYSLLNFVIQSIIQPKFTGESVGVTPAMSFLSLMFWYWVLGWIGALVALPATLLLKALLVDADPRARWVNAFISSSPRAPDDAAPAG
ncbi:AI-2E family transporter [Tersicoccus sp. Bi-70]|uniref:AI-2E family transporter n=1 Tax=Tersicoccus sp. Bi-70 TaxID=1897634 RepID=UPI001E5B7AA8|nr:AI-2E family transporter [Tersicoccus sp. Bi-70]